MRFVAYLVDKIEEGNKIKESLINYCYGRILQPRKKEISTTILHNMTILRFVNSLVHIYSI